MWLKLVQMDLEGHPPPAAVVGLVLQAEPGSTSKVQVGLFSPRLFVFDTIYRPVETELLRLANDAGSRCANGLSMLLHQGAKAFELWTKRKAPLAVMRRALRTAVYGERA